jgi:hypothetical protein
METVLLDHPWMALGLLYVGGWFIAFLYACRHSSPPIRDGFAPEAPGKARAKATE